MLEFSQKLVKTMNSGCDPFHSFNASKAVLHFFNGFLVGRQLFASGSYMRCKEYVSEYNKSTYLILVITMNLIENFSNDFEEELDLDILYLKAIERVVLRRSSALRSAVL